MAFSPIEYFHHRKDAIFSNQMDTAEIPLFYSMVALTSAAVADKMK
jgi:hypothetical protein